MLIVFSCINRDRLCSILSRVLDSHTETKLQPNPTIKQKTNHFYLSRSSSATQRQMLQQINQKITVKKIQKPTKERKLIISLMFKTKLDPPASCLLIFIKVLVK